MGARRYRMDTAQLSPQLLRTFLREMQTIRAFELRTEKLVHSGAIPGIVHLAIGQEAVAVGVIQALRQNDYVAGSHRGHHMLLAKGVDLKRMMAELMGKQTGLCAGKGGHMHIADYSKGVLGTNAIVGASIAIATGAAFTAQYLERDQVSVAFFGDGGTNKGQFHENLNMASVLGLPAIYVCENNYYAVETSVGYSTAGNDIAGRAASYHIPGVVVDGLDVLDVYRAAVEARRRAVAERRPTLIEAKTYRYRGHHMGDVGTYRTKEEVQEWMSKDPIRKLKTHMMEQGQLSETEWSRMQADIEQSIEEAVAFALDSPDPEPQSVMTNVYSAEVTYDA